MSTAEPIGLDVLISGAGIAGNVLAYWLLKTRGTRVTVVERDPQMRLTGQSIDIRGRAVDVIRRMGVLEAVRARCTHEEGMAFVDETGRAYARFMATGDPAQQSFTSEYEIFRGDLAKVLYDLVDGRVTTLFDDYVSEVRQPAGDQGRVEVTFAKSGERRSYDLVVAADGLASKMRAMVFGVRDREELHPLHAFCAFFTVPRDLLAGSRVAQWYSTTGGRAVLLRPDPAAGHTRALLNVVTPGGPGDDDTYRAALRAGSESVKALLADVFKDVGWITPEVLAEMTASKDFYATEIAQVKMETLYKERVVLLGDAGYCPSPMSGMGTSLAIVGAYVLAGELAKDPGDVAAALARYQAFMQPFARTAQQLPPGTPHLLCPQSAWRLTLLRTTLRFVSWTRLDTLLLRLGLGGAAMSESTLTLPTYPWDSPSQV